MSDLKAQIHDAMKVALKAKDKPTLGTIRLIQSAIKQIEVDERITIDDTRLLTVLNKMLKQRRDSINQYVSANREDLADKERVEIKVIQTFMPQALSTEELDAIIKSAIAEIGANSMRDMGAVMAIIKPKVQGRADMGQVSKNIKTSLAG